MSYDFQTVTHGKWILAGEHAVIRGHGALVFPLQDKTLTLCYRKVPSGVLYIETDDITAVKHDLSSLLNKILAHGLILINQPDLPIHGTFYITNQIPPGMGLGASAALCVAMARWFVANQLIHPSQSSHFARELEHLFHGNSSGLDIAAVSSTTGIYFKQGDSKPIEQTWNPNWQISSCGDRSTTADCIHKVQQLWQTNPSLAATIDDQMNDSVEKAKKALTLEQPHAQALLIEAIDDANRCFQQWGLISPTLQSHLHQLREKGALAVKPTGSGGGGMVISLWP